MIPIFADKNLCSHIVTIVTMPISSLRDKMKSFVIKNSNNEFYKHN